MDRQGISHIDRKIGNKGYTLVELIVTFALFAIFMTAVVMCLPAISKVYMQLQRINHEQTICNTISNEIKANLQGMLGVEGAGDPLGVETGNGIGYLCLLSEGGQQVAIGSGSAISSGSALLPTSDVTGSGIEFAYMNGIVAQMDSEGFSGYVMRKNKLQEQINATGAALTLRYYEADSNTNTKTTLINYGADSSISVASGVAVSAGEQNVAYAISYPHTSQFYEGFTLQTAFTIKKDAFYIAGAGTEESPSRVYVNYVNYTLSLLQDGDVCYSQDYVVDIQNAVPYAGTKVSVKEKSDESKDYNTYIKPGSLVKVKQDGKDEEITRQGYYYMTIHIGDSAYNNNFNDYWEITLPAGIKLNAAYFCDTDGSVVYYSPIFNMIVDKDNNKIKLSLKAGVGFVPISEFQIGFQVQSKDGKLFDEMMDCMDGVNALKMGQRVPLANSSNADIGCTVINEKHVSVNITPTVEKTKNLVRLEFDGEVDEVNAMYNTTNLLSRVDGKYIYLYARMTDKGSTDKIDLEPTFKDGTQHKLISAMVGDSTVEIKNQKW